MRAAELITRFSDVVTEFDFSEEELGEACREFAGEGREFRGSSPVISQLSGEIRWDMTEFAPNRHDLIAWRCDLTRARREIGARALDVAWGLPEFTKYLHEPAGSTTELGSLLLQFKKPAVGR